MGLSSILENKAQKILDYVEAHPGENVYKIAIGVGMPTSTVRYCLMRLVVEKHVETTPSGDDRSWVYRVIA